jgi:hypothetical protein
MSKNEKLDQNAQQDDFNVAVKTGVKAGWWHHGWGHEGEPYRDGDRDGRWHHGWGGHYGWRHDRGW